MAKTNNLGDFLKGIADKFRSKLGITGTINPQNFEDKIDAVYNAAAQKAYDDFWDGFQWNGNRTFYEMAFKNWHTDGLCRPKYKVSIVSPSRDIQMFDNNTDITEIKAADYDFSQGSSGDNSNGAGHFATFRGCVNLLYVEDVGMKAGYYYHTFRNCSKLHSIGKLRFNLTTKEEGAFGSCRALKNISFEGTVGKSIAFLDSPLTADTMKSLLDHLDTADSDSARTVTVKTAVKTAYDEKYGDWDAKAAEFAAHSWTFALV